MCAFAAFTDNERAARAALAAHFTPAQTGAAADDFDPAEEWGRRVEADRSGRLGRHRPAAELQRGELTARFLIPGDPEWPAQLADMGENCPLGLWVRGNPDVLTQRPMAVVGNRAASDTALHRARGFAEAAVSAGLRVSATLALGIDSTAHQAALGAGGSGVAVLPCGLDQCHPYAHITLLHEVVNGGAAVSVCPPGTRASLRTLRASEALVVALSRAVVLVEALERSVAMVYADAARSLARPLFVPPADYDDPRASGNARLLDEGAGEPAPLTYWVTGQL
ncbi:DNA-processing protein DprA [Streptomyces sp. NPDC046925]|uniref:DNA-processing protein DprA n=1 Tax=Streptomyces sp. NPDC046925 TaxID=3155375 RepID=UPI0033F943C6